MNTMTQEPNEPKTETPSDRAKRAWVTRKRNLARSQENVDPDIGDEDKVQALFRAAQVVVPEGKLRRELAKLIEKFA